MTQMYVEADLTLQMLERVEEALGGAQLSPWLAAVIGPYLKMRADRRFKSEGDEASGKWAPLLPATQQIRGSHPEWPVGPDHPINKRTGELEAWVTGGTFLVMPNAVGATLRYPGNAPRGELASKVKTAQKGKANPKTVARPILAVDTTDLGYVMSQMLFYLQKKAAI